MSLVDPVSYNHLQLEPSNIHLQVREDLKKGAYVDGLREQIVNNSDETIELLRVGASNRHVGTTKMNFESSRSHSVFSMAIESKVHHTAAIDQHTLLANQRWNNSSQDFKVPLC